ncbi:ComF family protein [Fusibacter ferrireducens]|uniref:ComF family protein n=1 Tax=Fusibacter ferrireducens TaxID=2785058 RepID=A0ABR9ZVL9_9FIRM|nr:phosphoribosyltransferase family protein [Fusibacter ferrireducens]MBF4694511.1 ComF family protein [Fusibacter ferrireducens]
MIEHVADLIFPEKLNCIGCDLEYESRISESFFCEKCLDQLKVEAAKCQKCDRPIEQIYDQLEIYQYKCKTCQEQFHYYKRHISCTHYDALAKKMILGLKYKGKTEYCKGIAELMIKRLIEEKLLDQIEVMVPTPIHWTRKWMRGYNQSELIAEALIRMLDREMPVGKLKRCKRTKKLKKLDKDARKQMLKDAIMITQEERIKIENKIVLVIDDIYTTGTTVNTCSKVLYEAGAEAIYCITFAMGQ